METINHSGKPMIPIEELKKDRLLRPDQVADILQVDKKTVYTRVAEGHFRIAKKDGWLRIWENSVYQYLQRITELSDYESGILDLNQDLGKIEEN